MNSTTMVERSATCCCLSLLLLQIAATAAAQSLAPNETDLRAMYCRPVVASAIARYATAPAGSEGELHAAAVERRRRLELYILPRLGGLDPAPLLAAQARGKQDAAAAMDVGHSCNAKCNSSASAPAAESCRRACIENDEAATRARDCDSLAWLPLPE